MSDSSEVGVYPNTETSPRSSTTRLLILFTVLGGFALRSYHLGKESLWYDETVSVVLARKSITELLQHTARDIHPPGYYIFLHFWFKISQPTVPTGLEYVSAFPSVVGSVVILVLLFAIGRRLFGTTPALVALGFAAINPFHVQYAQEVRMYALGAALGLVTLWAAVRFSGIGFATTQSNSVSRNRTPMFWLTAYAISAALGLYTLYYFGFLLLGLNLAILGILFHNSRQPGGSSTKLFHWLSFQGIVLLLWSPWLSIFLRQALNPPVPPWREPWMAFGDIFSALSETLVVLSIGEGGTGTGNWLLFVGLFFGIVLWAVYDYAKHNAGNLKTRQALAVAIGVVVLPTVFLFGITLFVVPLYHVRYTSIFAPTFALLVGIAYQCTAKRSWSFAIAFCALAFALAVVGLQRFWTDPRFESDDHRTAVRFLAENWRPGDAVIVNAGWVYTALQTYWPEQLVGPHDALPPHAVVYQRLIPGSAHALDPGMPVVFQTGSIDAPTSLGWGDPQSDFFSIPSEDVQVALEDLAESSRRIWHYRLYDTVNDPTGVIRRQLEELGGLRSRSPFSGPGNLVVEEYQPSQPATRGSMLPTSDHITSNAQRSLFGDVLWLSDTNSPWAVSAGEFAFVELAWTPLAGLPSKSDSLALSLRLADESGNQFAQTDTDVSNSIAEWNAGETYREIVALPISVSTPPGPYWLELLVYDRASLEPLPANNPTGSVTGGQGVRIGQVDVQLPQRLPVIRRAIARFDYIALVDAEMPGDRWQVGHEYRVPLTWLPGPSTYRDTYVSVLSIRDANGVTVASAETPIGGSDYPSGLWPVGVPVRQFQPVVVPATLSPGKYSVHVQLKRASDGLLIPADMIFFCGNFSSVDIGLVDIGF